MTPEDSIIIAHTPLRIKYVCYLASSQGISATTVCMPHGLFPFADKEFKAQEIKVLSEGHLAGNPGFKPKSLDFQVFLRAICPPPWPGDIWQHLETFLKTLQHFKIQKLLDQTLSWGLSLC